MLIAEYDSSWGDDEYIDQMNHDAFEDEVRVAFYNRKFPLVLLALSSNWRGQDGVVEVGDVEDVLFKVASFDVSHMQLHRGRGSALHFDTASHDCPTGIRIEVKPGNYIHND